ncbi:TerD family protein, partial [Candidatus Magnetaquicoccus inordinatus]|uniref:TerD family protein n=1 Tax=Candidatus Magnetaquicoccus inordinatus TaxID=2496818 RepID=UPI00187D5661
MGINLSKGQKISLNKESGQPLQQVVMGLGWDIVKKSGGLLSFFSSNNEIDLDASCLLFDQNNQIVDAVWFQQLHSRDGSIQHTGDNVTGAGEGDDEQILVNLAMVPQGVKFLVFVVNSFTGHTFDRVQNAYCRLVDRSTQQEVARYQLNSQGPHTAMIMAKLYRHAGEWKMHAIGENGRGKTFHE